MTELTETPQAICPKHQAEAAVLEITTVSGQKLWLCGHCLAHHDMELTGLIVLQRKNPVGGEQVEIALEHSTKTVTVEGKNNGRLANYD